MTRLHANQTIGLILALFSLGYLWMAFAIPAFPLPRPVDSDAFPKALGLSFLVLSIFLFFEQPEIPPGKGEVAFEGTWWQRPAMQVIATSLAIIVYAFALRPLGFVVASVALGFGLSCLYGYPRWVVSLIVSFSVVVALYLTMTKALGIYLPTGILPF